MPLSSKLEMASKLWIKKATLLRVDPSTGTLGSNTQQEAKTFRFCGDRVDQSSRRAEPPPRGADWVARASARVS